MEDVLEKKKVMEMQIIRQGEMSISSDCDEGQ